MSRTIIISDTHLGRPHGSAGSASSLVPLWKDCDRLIVNGDLAEVHHPEFAALASREVLALQDLCEADDVELTIVSGNHDPLLSDLRHLELAGGRILVTHGDALHQELAPWSPNAARLRTAHKAALRAIGERGRRDLTSRLAAAQHAAHHEWLEGAHHGSAFSLMLRHPSVIFRVLHAWRVFPRLAAEFADRHLPCADFVIIGHTHRPGIHRREGRTIINTGAFAFPGSPRAVIIEDETLSVWRITRRGGKYRLGRKAIKTFHVDAMDSLRHAA